MKKEISLIKFFLVILDFLCFFLSLILVLLLRFKINVLLHFQEHFFSFLFLFPFYFLILLAFNFYNFYFFNLKNIFLGLFNFFVIAFMASAGYFYFGQTFLFITPKTNLVIFILVFSLLLVLSRLAFFKIFCQRKIPVYFWGEEDLKKKLKKDLEQHSLFVYQDKVNDFDDGGVLIISPYYQIKEKKLFYFFNHDITIFDFIDFYERFLNRIPLEAINFDWVVREIFIGESKIYFYLKRIFDIFLAFMILIFIFLPFFIPIAILIYLNSPGSIFFVSERVGYRGKRFKLIKFRTMHNQLSQNEKWAVGDEEKRIFFIGKILRKTHLDELPQIFNIFKGELSFVGPRPEQPKITSDLEKQIPFYSLRYFIAPGLTGWAQINYKYPSNVEETKIKLEYDLYYLKNNNIFLDILIIIKTFQKFLTF